MSQGLFGRSCALISAKKRDRAQLLTLLAFASIALLTIILATGGATGLGQTYGPPSPPTGINLVSTDSAGAQGNDRSQHAAISVSGRYVAFASNATNLVYGDTNSASDVFVKDTQTNATTIVSNDSSGSQGNSGSDNPSISADGRYVAFSSSATNLVYGGTNGSSQIFVKDTQTATTTLASSDSAGILGNVGSSNPSISADGRYVAFSSSATNLVYGGTNGSTQVFAKDLQTGATTLVSSSTAGSQGNAGSNSNSPSFSADGHYVTFSSDASNLVPGDSNGVSDVFLKDTQTGITTRLSTDSHGTQGNSASGANNASGSYGASISSTGQYVAFSSCSNNLVPDDTNGFCDVFVKDVKTNSTTRVSTDNSGLQAESHGCYYCNISGAGISADGRYITFLGDSLSSLDTSGLSSPDSYLISFVKDTQTGGLKEISINTFGATAPADSTVISGDGNYVSFSAYLGNITSGSSGTNTGDDVFRASVGSVIPPEYNYYFPWYDNAMGHMTWVMGSSLRDSYGDILDMYLKNQPLALGVPIASGSSLPRQFPGRMDGPVRVNSRSNKSLISERSLFGSSFEEIWATPYSQLDSHYYWPYYNSSSGGSLSEWVLVANPLENGEAVQADLSFWVNDTPYSFTHTIQPGECWTPIYPGVSAHDVEVKAYRVSGSSSNNSDARKVITSERLLLNGAFNEMPGIPASHLDYHFIWTWYDSLSGPDVISIGNPNTQPVYVTVYMAGVPQGAPYLLNPNNVASWNSGTTNKYANGPVEVVACGDTSQPCDWPVSAYASQASLIGSAYEEIAGTDYNDLKPNANWTWYDEQSPGSLNWVLVSNPNPVPIYFEIKMPGVDPATTPGASGTLQPGQNKTPRFPGIMGGSVRVNAWTDGSKNTPATVMASQRVLWKGFFNEVVGLGL